MEVFLYTLTQLLQNCLICSSCYSSLMGLYQPFAWTSILWIPDVSGNETEKQRKLRLWAEVETCVPKSPTPCTLSTSKCIFGTFQFSFSWKGKKEPNQKLKPSKQTTVQSDAVSSFSLLRQLQTTPCQLLPLSRYSRANAHQNVVNFAAAIGNNIGSFATEQGSSTSHDTKSWKPNASNICEKTLSRKNHVYYL